MKLVFLGSGEFAVPTLERLHALKETYPLARVISRPDRPSGRGRKLTPMPVKLRALELGLPCDSPSTVNDPEYLSSLEALGAELYVVADYGELLGKAIRALPKIGMFNLHGSLLPRFRGASPVPYALLAGDTMTGVTLFRVERKLDCGPVVDSVSLSIESNETAGELEARLAVVAVELLERNLPRFATGSFCEEPQHEDSATLAPKIEKWHAEIDWRQGAPEIVAAVRAYNPWPGAFTHLQMDNSDAKGERTVIWRASVAMDTPPFAGDCVGPGSIATTKSRLWVQCGNGVVEVFELQRPGKATMNAAAYLNGMRLEKGARLSCPRADSAEIT